MNDDALCRRVYVLARKAGRELARVRDRWEKLLERIDAQDTLPFQERPGDADFAEIALRLEELRRRLVALERVLGRRPAEEDEPPAEERSGREEAAS